VRFKVKQAPGGVLMAKMDTLDPGVRDITADIVTVIEDILAWIKAAPPICLR
jgi:hypothetical protein